MIFFRAVPMAALLLACGSRTGLDGSDAGSDAGMDSASDSAVRIPCPEFVSDANAPVSGLAMQLALGDFHTCARIGMDVWCWGLGNAGQLGDGTTTSRSRPVRVEKLIAATDIASGPAFEHYCGGSRGSHTCAVLSGGAVSCWGSNIEGEGDYRIAHPTLIPSVVPDLAAATQVAVGGYHHCALLADTTVRCWGSSLYGALGDGTLTGGTKGAVAVQGLKNVQQVGVGHFHSCALLLDGSVSCWGNNEGGELGDGTHTTRAVPAPVVGLSKATAISTAWHGTCALLVDRTVACWGSGINSAGELGHGWMENQQPRPVKVVGLQDAMQISVAMLSACVVIGDGTVRCWGRVQYTTPQPPTRVKGLVNMLEVKTADGHACSRDGSGGAWCWGGNFAGQLGDGTIASRAAPVRVLP